nr:putative Ig domain-containing protein [uncultured Carboxylicivirga sp.]
MNRLRKLLVFAILIQFSFLSQINAQISFGGTPISFSQAKPLPEITNVGVNLNVEKLKAENLISRKESNTPPCIAKAIPVSYDMENSGTWTSLDNGGEMWQLRLKAEGALAILLSYDNFYIPQEAELFIYNADKTHVIGAYTLDTHPTSGAFSTEMVAGDDIILEYVSPYKHNQLIENEDFDNIPVISINNIGYVFDNVVIKRFPASAGMQTEVGESSSCMININCSEGDNWQTEKKGICQMLMYNSNAASGPGWYVCSGNVVNNTAQDLTPYVLSAFHCYEGSTEQDLSTWQFTFNYEASSCEDEEPANTHTITGCYLRVASPLEGGSDGILLELSQEIPLDWDVYYNGWDRRNIVTEGGGVGIHHPAGDIKKISTFETYTEGTWPGDVYGATNAHWNLQFIETEHGHSVTEGGSSGSSLFNSNHLVIGTLTGGNSTCSYTSGSNYYGKLWYHWDQYGTDETTQMKTWLDPLNLGVETLAGTALNPSAPRISSAFQKIELAGSDVIGVAGGATKVIIEGHNLDDIISITADDQFEVSTNNETWAQTATLPQDGGALYVRFMPSSIGHQTGLISLTNPLAPNFYLSVIASSCPEFIFDNSELPVATYNEPYSVLATISNSTTEFANYQITDGELPLGVELNGETGEISGTPLEAGTFNITLLVTDENGCFASIDYQLYVQCVTVTSFPFIESFEYGFPSCWSEIVESGKYNWTNQTGGNNGNEHPDIAYDGDFNMIYKSNNYNSNVSYLVTPSLDVTTLTNPILSFAHAQEGWLGDQDMMSVYYKTAPTEEWKELASYTNNITEWTLENIALPEVSNELVIGFKAIGGYAYGVVLDNVMVGSPLITPSETTLALSEFDQVNNQPVAEVNITASSLAEDITVTCSEPYLVSSDGIEWGSTCQIVKEGGILYITYTSAPTMGAESVINLQSTATETNITITDTSTGIDDISDENSDFSVVNPFTDELKMTWTANYNSVEIIDLSGRKVYESSSLLGLQSINIPSSAWSPGLYCVYLRGDEQNKIIKVIKK